MSWKIPVKLASFLSRVKAWQGSRSAGRGPDAGFCLGLVLWFFNSAVLSSHFTPKGFPCEKAKMMMKIYPRDSSFKQLEPSQLNGPVLSNYFPMCHGVMIEQGKRAQKLDTL